MALAEEVRQHCAAVVASARFVHIDPGAGVPSGGIAGLDPDIHLLEAPPEDRARYVLILDAVNFGSGWFHEFDTGPEDATTAFSRRLTDHARAGSGPWTPGELRATGATEIGAVLGVDPAHELMGLYAQGLRALGAWLGDRTALDAIAVANGSAQALARELARGMPFFEDRGLYKRAQITANDLVLAGVARFRDIDELTVFADNLLPHVLRADGVLHYTPELADRIDAGVPLTAGSREEVELRACAVHACERLARDLDVPPRVLDNWLWNRGLEARYTLSPPHRTRTTAY